MLAAAERIIERQSAEIERLKQDDGAGVEIVMLRQEIVRQSAEIGDLSRCVEVRDAQLTGANAEIEAARQEIERLNHAVETCLSAHEHDHARAEAAEARCKELEASLVTARANVHRLPPTNEAAEQRDRRDRLDKFAHPFLEKMFLVNKKSNPDLTVLEFVLSVMQEIDAKCEEGKR